MSLGLFRLDTTGRDIVVTQTNEGRSAFKMPGTKGLVWPITKMWLVGPVILFAVLQLIASIYRVYQGSVEGGLAVGQLKDSNDAYARSLLVNQSDIPGTINVAAWVILIIFFSVWLIRLANAIYEHRQGWK